MGKVTIVTGLWDLGRGELTGWGKRDFKNYKDRFFELLETDIEMCIWIPSDLRNDVENIRKNKPTKIKIKEIKDFETWNPFFNKIQEIRNKPEWKNFAGWLPESPQSALKYYNPMMFTKMFMLHDTSILNPFNTDYFFWIDGGITSTVNKGYFTKDKVLNNLVEYYKINEKFIHLIYSYIGSEEIHGFERKKMAEYCGVDYVNYVARGGFFGGEKSIISKINMLYYGIMEKTINEGYMGADECLFTILCHRHPELIHRFEIDGNGLVWKFFENLKTENLKLIPKNEDSKDTKLDTTNVGLYVLSFNSPTQFESLIKSMLEYDKDFIEKPKKKFLLDNSTDLTTTSRYKEICEKYNFEHIKKDNIGICGGRQFVAEHFNDTKFDAYYFFEDDMEFYSKKDGICRNGFNRYTPNLYKKSLEIIKKENFDYLKLNFTEFYGSNDIQFSWYNTSQSFREKHWPEKPKLPIQGLDPNAPNTNFKNIKSYQELPYAIGEIYLCNWPILMTKLGNYKCYIETKFQFPHEQSIMSYVYQETVKGNINSGVLLLTPTNHNRYDFYDSSLRKEC